MKLISNAKEIEEQQKQFFRVHNKTINYKEYELQELIGTFIDYRGKTPQKTTCGIPLITAKIIKNGQIQEPTEFIAVEDYTRWMTRGFPEINDVVLTTEAPLGEVALIKDTKVALAQRIITLQTNEDLCNNVYLKYLLQSPYGQSILQSRSSGSTVQGIKASELKKIKLRVPQIDEQKEIAAILSSLDDKIELNQQINKKLEEMAQAIFKEWFIDRDYKKFPISQFIDFNPSYKLSNSNEVAYLEMANVDTNSYRATNWCYRKSGSGAKFKNGDTLFARITPCLENGKTCFVDFLADNEAAYGSTEYIVMRSKDQFHPFLSYLIAKNKDFRSYAINTMTGTSGRQRAQADKLAHFEIRLPANEIITEINNQFESITSKLKNTSEQIDFLINIRDTLLPKLISGDVNIFVGNHL